MVTFTMATVGDPGNPSVGVIQTFGGPKGNFVDLPKGTGIYKTCSDAPKAPPPCLTVGSVDYTYGIAELETTVSQYVTFLNTVDPRGRNAHQLYFDEMNPTTWPQYGSISYDSAREPGQHYAIAYPEWANKPFNFGDFSRASRFVNSMNNGKVLSKTSSTSNGFTYVTYRVRLSPRTESGMYDVKDPDTKRSESNGLRHPQQRRVGQGCVLRPQPWRTDSYWAYPTGPFKPPNVSVLNPKNGNVTNASDQPLSTYNPNDPNSTNDTPGSPGRQGAPPGARRRQGRPVATCRPASRPGLTWRTTTWPTSAPSARPRVLALGHARPGRQRRRGARLVAPSQRDTIPAGLALLPRWCRQRAGLPGGDLGVRLLPG